MKLFFSYFILQLINGEVYLAGLGNDIFQIQVMLAFENFTSTFEFGLIVFSFHLLIIGYLAQKAGYLWKILGILLILAGMGYMIDGFGRVLSAGYDLNISLYTFIDEVVFIFWLLIKGWRIEEE